MSGIVKCCQVIDIDFLRYVWSTKLFTWHKHQGQTHDQASFGIKPSLVTAYVIGSQLADLVEMPLH